MNARMAEDFYMFLFALRFEVCNENKWSNYEGRKKEKIKEKMKIMIYMKA